MAKKLIVASVIAAFAANCAVAEGDARAGRKVFRKCKVCHSLKPGDHREGPSLFGVMGATAGAADGFVYSGPMRQAGFVWDQATLSEFLRKPSALVPGTTMGFLGLSSADQIADLVAYLSEATQVEP